MNECIAHGSCRAIDIDGFCTKLFYIPLNYSQLLQDSLTFKGSEKRTAEPENGSQAYYFIASRAENLI